MKASTADEVKMIIFKTTIVYYLLISITLIISWNPGAITTLQRELPSNNKPRISIEPNRPIHYIQAVNGPSEDIISCQTEGDSPEAFGQLRWHGPNDSNNFDFLAKRHHVYESSEGSNQWYLQFNSPTPADSGTYYCRGVYQADAINSSIEVDIFNPLRIENCPSHQSITKGRTGERIYCHIIADSPNIALYKDKQAIHKNDTRYKWNNEDAIIINDPADPKLDAGVYGINIFYKKIGKLQRVDINVAVNSAPEFVPYNRTGPEFIGIEGEQAVLKCDVAGNPQPLIYWTSPRRKNLTHEGGYHVNPEAGTLLIDKVRKFDDDGEFECKAMNNVGETSRRVTMQVHLRPQIDSFDNVTVSEGEEVVLKCRATGFPQPEFSIRKAGNNQQSYKEGINNTIETSTKIEESGRLVYIHSVRLMASRDHFGLHYCNATNQVGSVERVGKLEVNFKPDLSQTPPMQFYKRGRLPTITCHVRAFPAPEIKLFVGLIQVTDVTVKVKPSIDGNVHVATIQPNRVEQIIDSVFYCKAHNIMGQSSTLR